MAEPTPDREREALLDWLVAQRNHVLGVISGLSEEDLRRPVLPSGWSCLALVRHLALDDERFWFRAVAAGEPLPSTTTPAGSRHRTSPPRPCSTCTDRKSRPPTRRWPGSAWTRRRPGGRSTSRTGGCSDVREVILHVITETAIHAGHLDAARELLDGRTWMGPDDTRVARG